MVVLWKGVDVSYELPPEEQSQSGKGIWTYASAFHPEEISMLASWNCDIVWQDRNVELSWFLWPIWEDLRGRLVDFPEG